MSEHRTYQSAVNNLQSHLDGGGQKTRACDTVKVGDTFGWETVVGKKIQGRVIEIDSNVIVIRSFEDGQEHCYEA